MKTGTNRPLTSNKAANFGSTMYNGAMGQTKGKFELKKPDSQPDEQFKKIEREINKLIEDSAIASVKGNF